MARSKLFYGWLILALAFVSMGIAYGIWYSFTLFFVAVLRDFGWGRASTALAFSVFAIVHGLSSPLLGALVERLGTRLVMTLSALFLAASLAACSLVTEPWQYYVTFGVLTAIGVNGAGVLTNYVTLNRWFVKRRGLVVGIASAGIGLVGLSILQPLNQYLISTIGWRSTYIVLALIVGVVLPPLIFLLQRDRPQDIGLLPDGVPAPVPVAGGPAGEQRVIGRSDDGDELTLSRALRTVRFWALFGAHVLGAIAQQTIFVHQAAYFTDLGHDPLVAASVIAIIGLVSVPSKILWGIASDRVGREAIYTTGAAFVSSGLLLLLFMPGLSGVWPLYAFAVIHGCGYGIHTTLTPAISGDIYTGRHFPVIYGVLLIAAAIGSATGSFVAGFVFDVSGSYALAFIFAIACVALAATGVWIAAPRRARQAMRVAVGRN